MGTAYASNLRKSLQSSYLQKATNSRQLLLDGKQGSA